MRLRRAWGIFISSRLLSHSWFVRKFFFLYSWLRHSYRKNPIPISLQTGSSSFPVREMDLCYSISRTGNENKLTYLYIRAFFDIFGFDGKSNNNLLQWCIVSTFDACRCSLVNALHKHVGPIIFKLLSFYNTISTYTNQIFEPRQKKSLSF